MASNDSSHITRSAVDLSTQREAQSDNEFLRGLRSAPEHKSDEEARKKKAARSIPFGKSLPNPAALRSPTSRYVIVGF